MSKLNDSENIFELVNIYKEITRNRKIFIYVIVFFITSSLISLFLPIKTKHHYYLFLI